MTSHTHFDRDTKASEVADAFSAQIKDRVGKLSQLYFPVKIFTYIIQWSLQEYLDWGLVELLRLHSQNINRECLS